MQMNLAQEGQEKLKTTQRQLQNSHQLENNVRLQFEFNYSNRESEKPEVIKFMSNILPCPWEFSGDSLKFRIGTDREYFGLRKYI